MSASQLVLQRWEALYGGELTLTALRTRAAAAAAEIARRGWRCLVSYDTRFLADLYATDLLGLLRAHGVAAQLTDAATPLAAVELALQQGVAECALVVTAGNLPAWYGGLLLLTPAALAPDATSELEYAPPFPPAAASGIDLRSRYIERLRGAVDLALIRQAGITLFVDAMSGTAAGIVSLVIGEGQQSRAVEIYRDADPLFARRTPQPTVNELQRLRKLIRESKSHFGVAVSADGRALVLVNGNAEILSPARTALTVAGHVARQHRQRGLVVVPVVADRTELDAWSASSGIHVEAVADPAARIVEIQSQDRALLLVGVTALGELTVGRFGTTPDALLATMLVAELVAQSGAAL